jgi:hypothetical protein
LKSLFIFFLFSSIALACFIGLFAPLVTGDELTVITTANLIYKSVEFISEFIQLTLVGSFIIVTYIFEIFEQLLRGADNFFLSGQMQALFGLEQGKTFFSEVRYMIDSIQEPFFDGMLQFFSQATNSDLFIPAGEEIIPGASIFDKIAGLLDWINNLITLMIQNIATFIIQQLFGGGG